MEIRIVCIEKKKWVIVDKAGFVGSNACQAKKD